LNGMAEKELSPNASASSAQDGQLDLKKRARRRLVGAIALALLAVIVLPMVMDQEPKPATQDIQIRIPSQDPGSHSVISRITPHQPVPTPLPAEAKTPQLPAATATPTTPVPQTTSATSASAEKKTETKTAGKPESAAETKAQPKPETKAEPKSETKPSIRPDAKPAAAKPAAATAAQPEQRAEAKAPAKVAEKPAAAKSAESARAAALLNDEHWVIQLGAYNDPANVKSLQGKVKELGFPTFTEKVDTPLGARIRVRCGPFASREAAEKAQARLKKIGAGGPSGGSLTKAQ